MTARTYTLPRPPADHGSRAGSFGLAILVHLALGLLLLTGQSPPEARVGPPGWAFSADDGGGGGGGSERVHLLQLPVPEAPAPVPELPTVPDVMVQEPTVDWVMDSVLVKSELPSLQLTPPTLAEANCPGGVCGGAGGSGTGSGGGSGSGAGPGSGAGTGPGSGAGSGGGLGGGGNGIRPAAPLTILIPPAATPAVRGKSATVRLEVDARGAVRDAEVVTSSGDRGYDDKLRRTALGWRFRPARDALDRPVSSSFELSLRF